MNLNNVKPGDFVFLFRDSWVRGDEYKKIKVERRTNTRIFLVGIKGYYYIKTGLACKPSGAFYSIVPVTQDTAYLSRKGRVINRRADQKQKLDNAMDWKKIRDLPDWKVSKLLKILNSTDNFLPGE